jgi:hypothetical protein
MVETFTGPLSDLHELAERWKAECNGDSMGIETSVDSFLLGIQEMMDNSYSMVLVAKDGQKGTIVGLIGIQAFHSPIGSQRIANEHFWYVLPEYRGSMGIRLIEAARKWAETQRCSHFILNASRLSSDLHDRVCNLCERMGMQKFETSYIERIL